MSQLNEPNKNNSANFIYFTIIANDHSMEVSYFFSGCMGYRYLHILSFMDFFFVIG